MLSSLAHRFLLSLPPESAHQAAMRALEWRLTLSGLPPLRRRNERRVMGLSFANPVGLAAGFDKNGEYVDALATLGFGFIEVGGVTPLPQEGNALPRVFRLPAARALINRMGLNNVGAVGVAENLKRRRYAGVVGVNVGKNAATTGTAVIEDYLSCLTTLYPWGDFFTLNVSSPNTEGLRRWQQGEALTGLLRAAVECRERLATTHGKRKPLAIKIDPDLSEEDLEFVARAVTDCGVDGVVACNTTVERPAELRALPNADEAGGLSGGPLTKRSTAVIRSLRQWLPPSTAIIGVGGIFNVADAEEKLAAGADLVQIYTGFIYEGADLPRRLIEGIALPAAC